MLNTEKTIAWVVCTQNVLPEGLTGLRASLTFKHHFFVIRRICHWQDSLPWQHGNNGTPGLRLENPVFILHIPGSRGQSEPSTQHDDHSVTTERSPAFD
ncbi:hypothetical protein RRG08_002386 [Elysia crispata]|uniref:Uncharacterized protein n=1 Tax=Elysia crispata TaxID=231223 RepID=A0AAE1DF98_9GAST|nr:hypothetical protein RRG08_002386 [Elysia crispata]